MTQSEPEITEGQFEQVVYASIAAWLALVGPAVFAIPKMPDLSAIFRFEQFWRRQVDSFTPYLVALARRGWRDGAEQAGISTPFNPNDPYLLEALARTRNLLVRIPDETYRQIIKSVATGRDQGENAQQIRQRIDNVLTITGSENWPNRAKVIARTELNRFYNAGVWSAGLKAQQARQVFKQWISRDDPRVRPTHVQADGQRRRIGEPFEVGTSLLQQPQDPLGPAREVVNCRCRMRVVV